MPRQVAKLDRVPLPVEVARISTTGWQLTRTEMAAVDGALLAVLGLD